MKYTKEQRDFLFGQIDHALVFKTGLELNPTRVEILSEWLHEMENELQRLQESERWIPVSERLPEDDVMTIAQNRYGVFPSWFKNGTFHHQAEMLEEVTIPVLRWRPLPQPPEEEG